jgi:hypothetical protein
MQIEVLVLKERQVLSYVHIFLSKWPVLKNSLIETVLGCFLLNLQRVR